MIRFLIILTCTAAILVACADLRSANQKEQDAKTAAVVGEVGSLFGLPRSLVEGVAGLVLLGAGHIAGHKRGRVCERKKTSPLIPKV